MYLCKIHYQLCQFFCTFPNIFAMLWYLFCAIYLDSQQSVTTEKHFEEILGCKYLLTEKEIEKKDLIL